MYKKYKKVSRRAQDGRIVHLTQYSYGHDIPMYLEQCKRSFHLHDLDFLL